MKKIVIIIGLLLILVPIFSHKKTIHEYIVKQSLPVLEIAFSETDIKDKLIEQVAREDSLPDWVWDYIDVWSTHFWNQDYNFPKGIGLDTSLLLPPYSAYEKTIEYWERCGKCALDISGTALNMSKGTESGNAFASELSLTINNYNIQEFEGYIEIHNEQYTGIDWINDVDNQYSLSFKMEFDYRNILKFQIVPYLTIFSQLIKNGDNEKGIYIGFHPKLLIHLGMKFYIGFQYYFKYFPSITFFDLGYWDNIFMEPIFFMIELKRFKMFFCPYIVFNSFQIEYEVNNKLNFEAGIHNFPILAADSAALDYLLFQLSIRYYLYNFLNVKCNIKFNGNKIYPGIAIGVKL
ncbi:hypothetical protein KAU32_00050 [bacterium]|nr:hypothetical protein [bacterium]